jgi:hypothetical protein
MHIALTHYSGLRWATFNPCQPNIDVRGDPTFFRGLRTALIERNSICETWQIGKGTLLLFVRTIIVKLIAIDLKESNRT